MNEIIKQDDAKENLEVRNEDWYQHSVEQIASIDVETKFNAAQTILQGKWEIGKILFEIFENKDRSDVYGKGLMQSLSIDLKAEGRRGCSTSDLYACLAFYRKFPLLEFEKVASELPEGKNLTWYKVKQEYLPEKKKEKKRKQSFKIDDVEVVLSEWLVNVGLCGEGDVDEWVEEFREYLYKLKG